MTLPRLQLRRFALAVALLAVGVSVACSINPQPLPPGVDGDDNATGNSAPPEQADAGRSEDPNNPTAGTNGSAGTGGTAGTGGGVVQPTADGGSKTDANAPPADAGVDSSDDAGDATDADDGGVVDAARDGAG